MKKKKKTGNYKRGIFPPFETTTTTSSAISITISNNQNIKKKNQK